MTNYWIADAEGTRAVVASTAERDRLLRLDDWTESTEPDRLDFVWLRHEDPALGAVRMAWEAAQLPAWAGRGWSPGAPPVSSARPASPPAKTTAAGGDKNKEL